MKDRATNSNDVFRQADAHIRWRFPPWRRLAMHRDRLRAAEGNVAHGITRQFEGVARQSDAICLLSHFDGESRIDPFVIELARGIREAGADVVLVSSSPGWPSADLEAARQVCCHVLTRPNIGLDFGSWKDAVDWMQGNHDYRRLIIANDSVYGPILPLRPVFDEMNSRDCDFWGITDSFELGRHLQSYFVVFNEQVVASPVFKKFWTEFAFFQNKFNIIRDYEVGISRKLAAAGFTFDAFCSVERIETLLQTDASHRQLVDQNMLRRSRKSSPPLAFWRLLLVACGCPFIKRQLVRENPLHLPSAGEIRRVLDKLDTYDANLAWRHLSRSDRIKNGK